MRPDLLGIVRQRPEESNDIETTRAMVRDLSSRTHQAIVASP